ncbi:UDP-glycosyltransferase 89A2 isoform X2 [Ziziphus jujuba]|nr:UDP-glycosyltransferase 89A2 isoform X2 [Ziziphus jujuba]
MKLTLNIIKFFSSTIRNITQRLSFFLTSLSKFLSPSKTMSTPKNKQSTHILMFPFPAQGHSLALLDLTHQLSLRNLSITILTTPKNLPDLHRLLVAHPTIQTLTFPFPPHPKLPPGVENVRQIGNPGNIPIINALSDLQQPIVEWFNQHPNPPVAIVSDFFLGWTLRLANRIGIPRISFFSIRVYLASVLDHCWRDIRTVLHQPVVEFHGLPRCQSFKHDHLPSIVRRYDESDPDMEIVQESLTSNLSSWGCIFNSFEDLESEYFDHLRTKMGLRRVYGVGPLSLIGIPEGLDRAKLDENSGSNVLDWLDGCPDGSVVYVCFGSQKLLTREQMEALASGLEQSRTRFVWVVKVGTDQEVENGYGVVPDGFDERVAGRGLVVRKWAPQVTILSHRAVGGFLSHCGWNSTLEGIVAGVMILAWPMEADQFVNARLLVEDMGMAVKVCEGGDGVPDSDELGKLIAESMTLDCPEKVKAKEMKDKAFAAVKDGGSSSKDLDELVRELHLLKVS